MGSLLRNSLRGLSAVLACLLPLTSYAVEDLPVTDTPLAAVTPVTEDETQGRAVPATRGEIQLSFAPVVKQVAPAVVNIYTSRKVQIQNPFMNDPFFRQFFGNRMNQTLGERTVNSLGSGVIIGADGLVVTSNHVIQGSDSVNIVLSDRREFEGKVVLNDPQSDLALLRIDTGGKKVPYLKLHNSDTLEVGDLVLAVGNPFGVGQSVTSGIISALARNAASVADYQFFIQTDAAINPGNSGGALVDMQGRLIGINTAIYSTSGASIGIGFAIPANMVESVVASATSGRTRVVRPWLGLGVQSVNAKIADSLGMSSPRGVLVKSVSPDSPAQKAGVQVSDVVLSINGHDVHDEQTMHFRAAISKLDENATFVILRNGKEETLQMRMIAPPENPKRDARGLKGRHPFDGVTVANLSPAVAAELGLDVERGVAVTEVTGNRLFRKGDIILRVNNLAIGSSQALATQLNAPVRNWLIAFVRDGKEVQVNVR
ncbi:MAG: Do family serine endopeptidase [Alphaproteobacteria bacterium]|nr:Do family serine endopeptidase [Alphaproteobacteria bacterium]